MAPLLSSDVRVIADAAALGAKTPLRAVERGEPPDLKDGLRPSLDSAGSFRAAASAAVSFLAVRTESEMTQLVTSDEDLDMGRNVVNVQVGRGTNDQVGVGRLAFLAAIPAWGDARPAHLITGQLQFRYWVKRMEEDAGRTTRSVWDD